MKSNGQGFGCAVAIIALNTLLIGLLTSQFAHGPYSSHGQEIWYRYGSLGFLLFGVVLPAAALAMGARRSPALIMGIVVWAMAVFVACIVYVRLSGGGV